MIMTEKGLLREQWLADGLCPICGEDHRRGIGGTMMAMILGLVEWNGVRYNALDAYHRLTRDLFEPGLDSIHTWRGNFLEPHIPEWYRQETGREIVPFSEFEERPEGWREGWAEHPEFPAFIVHPDAVARDPDGSLRVVEIKAPSREVFGRVYEQGLRKSEAVQLQTYAAVLRLSRGGFAFGSTEHEAGPILPFDLDLQEELGSFILEIGQRFMDEHVVPRIPPEPEDWKLIPDPELEVLVRPGELETVDPEQEKELAEISRLTLELKRVKKETEDLYKQRRAEIQALVEDRFESDKVLLPGVARISIVRSEGRASFSRRALEGHKPIDRDKLHRMIREEGVDRLRDATDTQELDAILEELELDLDRFERSGSPYSYALINPHKT